jgi:peptidoglycan/LPS O-acetylase OafA/YrhL
VVLIPCLVITLVCDKTAIALTHSAFYQGQMPFYSSGTLGPVRDDISIFVANLLFLQTIVAPVFGSNTPLWSLACEFWYYLVFPLLFIPLAAIKKARPYLIALAGLMVFAVGVVLPQTILKSSLLVLFPAWLMGYAAALACQYLQLSSRLRLTIILASTATLLVLILLAKTQLSAKIDLDLIEAVAVAALIVAAIDLRVPNRLHPVIEFFSNISYSLYLSHFALLALLSAVFLGNKRLDFAPQSLGVMAAFCAAALFLGTVAYFLFEQHTAWVKMRIKSVAKRLYALRPAQ